MEINPLWITNSLCFGVWLLLMFVCLDFLKKTWPLIKTKSLPLQEKYNFCHLDIFQVRVMRNGVGYGHVSSRRLPVPSRKCLPFNSLSSKSSNEHARQDRVHLGLTQAKGINGIRGVEIAVLRELKEGEVHTAEEDLDSFPERLQRTHWEMGEKGRGDKDQAGKCALSRVGAEGMRGRRTEPRRSFCVCALSCNQ